MPSGNPADVKLEIGHVLFIDIVGYSKLLVNQQSELLHELNEVVSGTNEFREAEAEKKLTRLPTGDGMALVFRTDPEAPAQCALEIGRALKEHPAIALRIAVRRLYARRPMASVDGMYMVLAMASALLPRSAIGMQTVPIFAPTSISEPRPCSRSIRSGSTSFA